MVEVEVVRVMTVVAEVVVASLLKSEETITISLEAWPQILVPPVTVETVFLGPSMFHLLMKIQYVTLEI